MLKYFWHSQNIKVQLRINCMLWFTRNHSLMWGFHATEQCGHLSSSVFCLTRSSIYTYPSNTRYFLYFKYIDVLSIMYIQSFYLRFLCLLLRKFQRKYPKEGLPQGKEYPEEMISRGGGYPEEVVIPWERWLSYGRGGYPMGGAYPMRAVVIPWERGGYPMEGFECL